MKQGFSLYFLLAATAACTTGPTGTATFTTRGDESIERGITAEGDEGFVDGWSLSYDKFLMSFYQLTISDDSGQVGAITDPTYIVDQTAPGSKQLFSVEGIEAKAWNRVSYMVMPPLSYNVLVSGDEDDLALLKDAGYSVYISGTASKGDVTKTFALGFTEGTLYEQCHSDHDGEEREGIVVPTDAEELIELTTHGDHLFYDRLQGPLNDGENGSLRFDALAMADDEGNADGDITANELRNMQVDADVYDLSQSDGSITNLFDFINGRAHTIGHFQGEGVCSFTGASRN